MPQSLEVSMKRVANAVKSGKIKKAEKLFNKVMNAVEEENKKKNSSAHHKNFTFKHHGGGRRHRAHRSHRSRKN